MIWACLLTYPLDVTTDVISRVTYDVCLFVVMVEIDKEIINKEQKTKMFGVGQLPPAPT